MDIFTQKKILMRGVLSLVLINICSISFFLWKDAGKEQPVQQLQDEHGAAPRVPYLGDKDRNTIKNDENGGQQQNDERRELAKILEHKLGLTPKQAEQIKDIRQSFFEKEKILEAIIRGERDSMNMEMFNKNTNEEHLKNLAHNVSENEYKMELLRIEQARQLKAVCTPKQLEKLNSLVIEIRDYFRPNNKPDRQPPSRE